MIEGLFLLKTIRDTDNTDLTDEFLKSSVSVCLICVISAPYRRLSLCISWGDEPRQIFLISIL